MLATSRSASSCNVPSSRTSSIIHPSEYTDRIEYQRRAAVGEQRCAGEDLERADGGVERLHDDRLPPDELVDRERGTPVAELGHDRRRFLPVRRRAQHLPHPHDRKLPASVPYEFALPLLRDPHLVEVERLGHVRDRNRVV